jgi:hypothetical protein
MLANAANLRILDRNSKPKSLETKMPDIRYVCLSDMHLGAQNSVLTNLTPDCRASDLRVASPVLAKLVECLRTLIGRNDNPKVKPTLILAGDILELALTTDNEAAMGFERFIELIMPPPPGEPLFDKIQFLPGNHDHHLWETSRETQYVKHLGKSPKQRPGMMLDVPWHATSMFLPTPNPNAVPSIFINGIIQRYPHLADMDIETVYPNLGLLSADGRRCVMITHGHFIEPMYLLMSTVKGYMFPKSKRPELTWDYEAENFAWIDFFWSTMGRSGDVGTDVEIVYDKLQDPKQVQILATNIADALLRDSKRSAFMKWLLKFPYRLVCRLALKGAGSNDRGTPEQLLGEEATMGLRQYMEGPVLKQMEIERGNNIAPEMAVIFGHTHKPFEATQDFAGYSPNVKVYNSGGWAVDTLETQPLHGGAVILIDEDLNIASLRMYNEAGVGQGHPVSVRSSSPNPFQKRLATLVDFSKDPWKSFSAAVSQAIPDRQTNLRLKTEMK